MTARTFGEIADNIRRPAPGDLDSDLADLRKLKVKLEGVLREINGYRTAALDALRRVTHTLAEFEQT